MGTTKHIGRIGALAVAPGIRNVRRNATRMTVSIGVAVQVVMATVVLALVSTLSPAVRLSADSTALIMGGTSVPTPDDAYIELVKNHYIAPTHPGQDLNYVAVTTPEEFWPITGLGRLAASVVGAPSIWGPGGPGWPDEPWWKLSGLFDLTIDQSIQAGVADLEQAMDAHGNDHLVIYAYSQGAVVANLEKQKLAEQYPEGTTPPDVDFVLSGDLNLPNGGLHARFPGLYIPVLDWSFNGPEPTSTPFDTTVITRQYDGLADFPLYPLNLIADLNAVLGIAYVHLNDLDVSLPADPSKSPAYQGTYGKTSYYFFPTADLPLFDPLRSLGVPESLIDVVEPFFRVLVELGYDRTIPPWEPTPARLIPTLDPGKVATDLVNAVKEGVNNALALVGSPALLRSRTPARVAALGSVGAAPNTANAGISAEVSVSEAAAQQNPAPSTGPLAQQNPTALTPPAGNASKPSVKPKPKPSATTLTPKAPKPARRPTTQGPVGQPTHDAAVPRNGKPTTAGSNSDGAPKPESTSSPTPAGSSSTASSAGRSSPGGRRFLSVELRTAVRTK